MDQVKPIAIAIMTVQREPQYVHQTIASLLASADLKQLAPVHLVVGSADVRYLRWYEHHSLFQTHGLNADEWQELSSLSVWRRICHTAYRCLRVDAGALGLCVLEDDVVLVDGFVDKLLRAVTELRAAGQRRFVLSGYVPYRFNRIDQQRAREKSDELGKGRHFLRYSQPFYGSCCLFFSHDVIEEAAELVLHEGCEQARKPYDILVGQRFRDEQQILFATRDSLAQHIGDISSYESLKTESSNKRIYRSPTFTSSARSEKGSDPLEGTQKHREKRCARRGSDPFSDRA